METDLLVTTIAPDAIASALLAQFPTAEMQDGSETWVIISAQQSVRAHRDPADPGETNVNVYDRSWG